MGKLLNGLVFMMSMEFVMVVFAGQTTPVTALLSFLTNPSNWSSNSFLTYVIGLTTAASLASIFIGSILYKSDFFIFGGLAGVMISYGAVIFKFLTWLQSQSGFHNNPISIMIITPILLAYMYACIKFWRGWD